MSYVVKVRDVNPDDIDWRRLFLQTMNWHADRNPDFMVKGLFVPLVEPLDLGGWDVLEETVVDNETGAVAERNIRFIRSSQRDWLIGEMTKHAEELSKEAGV